MHLCIPRLSRKAIPISGQSKFYKEENAKYKCQEGKRTTRVYPIMKSIRLQERYCRRYKPTLKRKKAKESLPLGKPKGNNYN